MILIDTFFFPTSKQFLSRVTKSWLVLPCAHGQMAQVRSGGTHLTAAWIFHRDLSIYLLELEHLKIEVNPASYGNTESSVIFSTWTWPCSVFPRLDLHPVPDLHSPDDLARQAKAKKSQRNWHVGRWATGYLGYFAGVSLLFFPLRTWS